MKISRCFAPYKTVVWSSVRLTNCGNLLLHKLQRSLYIANRDIIRIRFIVPSPLCQVSFINKMSLNIKGIELGGCKLALIEWMNEWMNYQTAANRTAMLVIKLRENQMSPCTIYVWATPGLQNVNITPKHHFWFLVAYVSATSPFFFFSPLIQMLFVNDIYTPGRGSFSETPHWESFLQIQLEKDTEKRYKKIVWCEATHRG